MIFSGFTRRSFQNVLQPWWTVYNDFYPVATEVTSSLLSLAWRLPVDPIVGSNAPKPNPIYASLWLAFHPKCALSARKCIAQYRLKCQIIHCRFLFWIRPCLHCVKCCTLQKYSILIPILYEILYVPKYSVAIHIVYEICYITRIFCSNIHIVCNDIRYIIFYSNTHMIWNEVHCKIFCTNTILYEMLYITKYAILKPILYEIL